MTSEFYQLSAVEMSRQIRARAVSATDVLEAHLARIAEVNPVVNAVVTLTEDMARAQAASVDARLAKGEPVGPLAGLPVGVKDTFDTKGVRTTYGSPIYADHLPERDDIVVQRLKQADGVIIGKTNTPEFATGGNTVNRVFGATVNPWNTELTAGGSTGGGGAGLTAGMFPLAVGSDLAGSLRIPASFCGVAGLRPTPGVVPSGPVAMPYDTLAVSGPMARSAGDIGLLLGAMAGPHGSSPLTHGTVAETADDPLPDLSNLTIAYADDVAGIGIDDEVAALCRDAVAHVTGSGYAVADHPLDLSDGPDSFTTLRGQWMVNKYRPYLDRLDQLDENLAGNIEKGLGQTPEMIASAEAARADLWSRIAAFFETAAILLTPSAPITPFPVGQNYPETINGRKMKSYIDWVAPTMVFSLLGLPALSVPVGRTEAGMPVGLQLVGPRFSEATLIAFAETVLSDTAVGMAPI